MYDVVIIGGGPAGLMATWRAALRGRRVLVLDKNRVTGRKLRITGKGRCNITNSCDREAFFANIPTNPKFLYSALSRFSNQDLVRFFEECGVQTKVERGGRIFPESDRAADVADALERRVREEGTEIWSNCDVVGMSRGGEGWGVALSGGKRVMAESVVIATGGASYGGTGSTGDGYHFARRLGHRVVPVRPSLVPLVVEEKWAQSVSGLALKNVELSVFDEKNRLIFREFGEMLFTHFGLSGPIVLSASAHMREFEGRRYRVLIDLKPALDIEKLDKRILRDFEKYANRDFRNALGDLLPKSLIDPIVELCGIDGEEKVNGVTREKRRGLAELLKAVPVTVIGARPIEEAIVTSGGVDVREVNPSTMESKIAAGVYFAGEVLDVDGYTGGFNLQIAFSTGFLAGENA